MATTIMQVAERLGRRMKGGNVAALSMAAAMDVVEALNAGLQESYEVLPSWLRRSQVSLTLPAPTIVSANLTQGSASCGGSTFTLDMIGRSAVFEGDTNWNEVDDATKLLDAYQGPTGTHNGTIYGDSVFADLYNFDSLAGDPRMAETRETLIPFNPRKAAWAGSVGKPKYYWVEAAGASLGAEPPLYLRVLPAPDRAYVIRLEVEFRPSRLTYAALFQPTEIPLREHLIDSALIPLCELRLLRSPEWADRSPAMIRLVQDAATTARGLLSNQSTSGAAMQNRVLTPPGW